MSPRLVRYQSSEEDSARWQRFAHHQQLSPDEIARYRDRTSQLADPDLLAGLHRDENRG